MEIPYKWEEAPAWARRSYYQNYPDSKCNEKNLQHFYNGATMQQEFYLVDSVLTADILEAVFDKQAKDLLNGRSDAETKKIALIITSIPGWERKQLYSRGMRRGFYNKRNAVINKTKRNRNT